MKLRIASDIHTEFWGSGNREKITRVMNNLVLPPLEDDLKTTLILAGDLGSMHKPDNILFALDAVCPRFHTVIYTPGNHEYYGGTIQKAGNIIREMTKDIKNLCFGEHMFLDDSPKMSIHACTLWTDFDGGDAGSMDRARRGMNDYRVCGLDDENVLQPEHTAGLHALSLKELKNDVKKGDIIITHHLPSFQSIDPNYTHSSVNGAYATDLTAFIMERQPALWVHGHTHASNDYHIGATRVVSNPRGYEHDLNPTYNSKLVVEV